MSFDWLTKPLGEIVSFRTGKLDSNASEDNGKYPFFTCSPITLRINDFAFDTEAVILAGNNANGVFSTKHYSGKFNAYQRTYVIEPLNLKEVSCRYIYFVISHMVSHLQELAIGTSTKFLTKTILNGLTIHLPPKIEQDQIAVLLSSLDDRIALLRETNTTLEAIAQALFKSWFVDFDPVHAKQACRERSRTEGREPEGVDSDTAALFPDSFEESELGLVPSGWQVTNLADAFEINPTRTLKKGSIAPYLEMAKLATSGHCVETPIQREMGSGAKFRNGDTLLARITPCLENGKSAFVDFLEDDQIGWGSTEFLVLRPKAPLPEYFAYLLCRHPIFREYAIQSMSGTSGRQRIQNDVLGRYLLALPDDGVASAFTEVVDSIQKSIAGNHETAQTLATLRDTLIPRLISGQLRLPDANALIEETTA
ncbi:MAG: restriction endonuclease subunit S [Methylobacter sp.]